MSARGARVGALLAVLLLAAAAAQRGGRGGAGAAGGVPSSGLLLLRQADDRLELALETPRPALRAVVQHDGPRQALRLPDGFALPAIPGAFAVPFRPFLVGAPPGARIEVTVAPGSAVQMDGLDLAVVPEADGPPRGSGQTDASPATPDQGASAPCWAQTEFLGSARGVATHAVRLFPYQYDPGQRTLRVYQHLAVQVRFVTDSPAHPAPAAGRDQVPSAAPTAGLVNPAQARGWAQPAAAPKPAQDGWYDRARPWLKLHVGADGVYCLGTDLLAQYLDPAALDPRTLRLYCLGQELPLAVTGEADGRLDPPDRVLFAAAYRRDDRDFGSLYGDRNTYWLTWGGPAGRRYAEVAAAPDEGQPPQTDFWSTVHLEVDTTYDPLPAAVGLGRDNWFWREVRASGATTPGSAPFVGATPDPVLDSPGQARVRVALYGGTAAAHHTVVTLNATQTIADTVWGSRSEGQSALVVEREVPAGALREDANTVVVQVHATQDTPDQVYLDWFEIDYRRRLAARAGFLAFGVPAGPVGRIWVSGLRDRGVVVLDPDNAVRPANVRVDSVAGGLRVALAHRRDGPGRYVLADSLALRTPVVEPDTVSFWCRPDNQADYVVVADPALVAPALRLAAHRRLQGLRTAVVSTKDIYDEFGYGLMSREAVAAFIAYAGTAWQHPPAFVVLLGDDTYDYRNVKRGGVPCLVPTMYYHSAGRGRTPSDYLLSLIDGDDLLADVAVGRLAASSLEEAETIVDKVIRYDLEPAPGDWRSRVLFLAGYHATGRFAATCDSLARHYTEPYGLQSVKIYNDSETPVPNEQGRQFLDELERGALLLDFAGHGSSGSIWYFLSLQMPDWDYLSLVRNGARLPLGVALSCLNGIFVDPQWEGLGEALTGLAGGGTIAFVSATAQTLPVQNDLLGSALHALLFQQERFQFGPVLDAAKAQVLAAYPGWSEPALGMELFGDPAQSLAVPGSADYSVSQLRADPAAVRGQDTVGIWITVANSGRRTADSLDVLLRARGAMAADVAAETLAWRRLEGFVGSRQLQVDWDTGTRRGAQFVEAVVDPSGTVLEDDESNNRRGVSVEILEPVLPIPVTPADGATQSGAQVRLAAAVPVDGGPYRCDFRVAADADFAAADSLRIDGVPAAAGVCACSLATVGQDPSPAGQYRFWQVRLQGPVTVGAWTAPRTFRLGAAAGATWSQWGEQLRVDLTDSLSYVAPGVVLKAEAAPLRPAASTRLGQLVPSGLAGAGVVCADGRYVYAKRWFNDETTVYPGTDYFTRVGTGYGGTVAGQVLGTLPDTSQAPPTAGISATCHGDGYIYNECGRAYQLERLALTTGVLDTVAVPEGLLEWRTGQVVDGHALLASDGRLVYNVAMSSPKGMRTEWRVRVFDPAAGWRLVREFVCPPTRTGFTFLWTDGVLADGERLYFIEYGGERRIRMVDARDGALLDEWTSDQETTGVLSGQYDWVNNKVWLGDLFGPSVFMYPGLKPVDRASLVSPVIGPAAAWQRVRVSAPILAAGGTARVEVLVPAAAGGWEPRPGLALDAGQQELDLRSLDPGTSARIRLRAELAGPPGAARLDGWEVFYTPLPSLELCRAQVAAVTAAGLRVQVVVRNLAAAEVNDAELVLERGGQGKPVRRRSLPTLAPGRLYEAALDSVPEPPQGAALYALVRTPLDDADPSDNRRQVWPLLDGRTLLVVRTWPDGGSLRDGDLVRPDQGLAVSAPGVAAADLQLRLDGEPVWADSLLDADPPAGPAVLLRPRLEPGAHTLEARLLVDGAQAAVGTLRFRCEAGLALANPLVFPNPARGQAWLTYVLSVPASVEAEVFSLSGRSVRRLGPLVQDAGFNVVEWDGADHVGRQVANGTYVFVLTAAASGSRVTARGALAVVR